MGGIFGCSDDCRGAISAVSAAEEEGRLTSMGLEALIAVKGRPVAEVSCG